MGERGVVCLICFVVFFFVVVLLGLVFVISFLSVRIVRIKNSIYFFIYLFCSLWSDMGMKIQAEKVGGSEVAIGILMAPLNFWIFCGR